MTVDDYDWRTLNAKGGPSRLSAIEMRNDKTYIVMKIRVRSATK
jgi:hypothetical protein